MQKQATIVSENFHRTILNMKVLGEMPEALLNLDRRFVEVATSRTKLMDVMTQLEVVFLHIRRHIEEIQIQVESITFGLTSLCLERLSPELYPPKKLIHLSQEITKNIPQSWNLIIPAYPDNMRLL